MAGVASNSVLTSEWEWQVKHSNIDIIAKFCFACEPI